MSRGRCFLWVGCLIVRPMLYDKKKLQNVIYKEGLWYAVRFYLNAEAIEDKEIAQAWKKADDAFKSLETVLTKKGIEISD